jgi:hypothetical protein
MKMITISFCILIVVDVCISVRIRSMYDQSKCLNEKLVYRPLRIILIAEQCSSDTTLAMFDELNSGWWQIKTNDWWINDGKRPWPYGNIGANVWRGEDQVCVMLNTKTDEAEFDHLCKNGAKIKLTYVASNSGMGWHIINPYDKKNPCLTYNKGEPYNVYFGDCHLTNGKWETNEMWLIEDF